MNNATLLTADSGTHVKVVLIALIASIAVSMIGINVHRQAGKFRRLLRRLGASRSGPF